MRAQITPVWHGGIHGERGDPDQAAGGELVGRRRPPPPWVGKTDDPFVSDATGPGADGPLPGEIYHVDTDLLARKDAHPGRYRPVVVVSVHADIRQVRVYTRTSDLDEPGVPHHKNDELMLDKDGVFGEDWYQTIDLGLFKHPLVLLRGMLDRDTWDAVVEMDEAS